MHTFELMRSGNPSLRAFGEQNAVSTLSTKYSFSHLRNKSHTSQFQTSIRKVSSFLSWISISNYCTKRWYLVPIFLKIYHFYRPNGEIRTNTSTINLVLPSTIVMFEKVLPTCMGKIFIATHIFFEKSAFLCPEISLPVAENLPIWPSMKLKRKKVT